MRLLKYAPLLFVLLFVTGRVLAQNPGSISGKLVDPNNQPVSYATVTLLKTDSSVVNGDLSKDDGSFSIASIPVGNYIVRIESIGMLTKYVAVQLTTDAPEKKMGKIKLSEGDHALKEVQVTGEKPIMELKVDKKVFNVEKNTTTAGGSATDVLQNVPSVSVDADGTVNLRGKSDVTILIDGKPATLLGSDVTSALQSLPASSIESVEVITNPSAKYDAQGSTGIINIVTKKTNILGVNGNVSVGAGTNDKYNGNLGLNVRKGKWNAFLNSSARQHDTWNNVITDKHDDTSSQHTYEHVPRHFDGFFNTIGVTYDPDKYNSITLTENINKMQFGFRDYSDFYSYDNKNEIMDSSTTHQNKYTDFLVNIFSISSALDYRRKFKKKDEELSVDATYAHTDINKTQNFTTYNYPDSTGSNPIFENAPGSGYNNSTNIWADYSDPLFTKNGKLGLGFKSQFYDFFSVANPLVEKANSNIFTSDSSLLNNFNYSQQIHAAYANWSDQQGKFGYQLGVRVEDAIYSGRGQIPADTSFSTSFLNLFPSAFISYQLGNQQTIYLNYSRRTNRPGFMQLLPFKDFSNPGTVNMGNPGLIPEFINNVEFSYGKTDNRGDNIILSGYYSYTENLTQRVVRPISNDAEDVALGLQSYAGRLLSQPVNISSGTTYGLEGTAHIQIIKAWDATVNVNYFENMLNVSGVNSEYLPYLQNNNGSSWFGKLNTNVKLPKSFSLQINANYESPKVVTEGHIAETYWIDVALRKNFLKNKATLILNCSDIFNTHTNVTTYNIGSSSETINRIRETRIGNINFTYRFGKSDIGKDKIKNMNDKNKPPKPGDEERDQNLKQKEDNDQPGGGGGGQRGGGGQGGNGGGANGGNHN